MGALKAEADSSETGAIFRRHSQLKGAFVLSEWRDAFSDLHEVLNDPLLPEESKEPTHWLDIGGSTFMETEDTVGLLKPVYGIENERELRLWLERYPGSKKVLLLAPDVVGNYFPDAELRLEIRTDPETGDQCLGIYVRTDLDPSEAVDQFTTFDSRWGDKIHALTDGDLLINIESKS
jgi:hypothetical protein